MTVMIPPTAAGKLVASAGRLLRARTRSTRLVCAAVTSAPLFSTPKMSPVYDGVALP